jgi:hypothetical protein
MIYFRLKRNTPLVKGAHPILVISVLTVSHFSIGQLTHHRLRDVKQH